MPIVHWKQTQATKHNAATSQKKKKKKKEKKNALYALSGLSGWTIAACFSITAGWFPSDDLVTTKKGGGGLAMSKGTCICIYIHSIVCIYPGMPVAVESEAEEAPF